MFSKKRKYSEVRDLYHSIQKLIEKCTMLEHRVRTLERKRQLQDELPLTVTVTKRSNQTSL